MTLYVPPWIGAAISILVCGAAIWKGGSEERIAGLGFLIAYLSTVFLRDYSWPSLQRGTFLVDAFFFALLLALAMKTTRYWPLAAAGFQLLAVLTHVAKIMDAHLEQWAYITAGLIWTYLILVAIAVGTINAVRLRRRYPATERPAPAGATRR